MWVKLNWHQGGHLLVILPMSQNAYWHWIITFWPLAQKGRATLIWILYEQNHFSLIWIIPRNFGGISCLFNCDFPFLFISARRIPRWAFALLHMLRRHRRCNGYLSYIHQLFFNDWRLRYNSLRAVAPILIFGFFCLFCLANSFFLIFTLLCWFIHRVIWIAT